MTRHLSRRLLALALASAIAAPAAAQTANPFAMPKDTTPESPANDPAAFTVIRSAAGREDGEGEQEPPHWTGTSKCTPQLNSS